MRIFWSNKARNDLKSIKAYLSYRTSYLLIDKFIKKIINRTDILKTSPYLGRIVPEYNLPNLGELIEKKYHIIYRVKQGKIYILTVFEGHKLLIHNNEITFTEST